MATKKVKAVVEDNFDRAGFEIWAKSRNYDTKKCTGDGGWGRKGEYAEHVTLAAWDGWRAAKGYVGPKVEVDFSKLKITIEHEEEGDGEWQNDTFTILFNGKTFAYCSGFLEKKIPFNWDMFCATQDVADAIAKKMNFSGLNKAKNPEEARALFKKQVDAWVQTPKAKKVIEHFFQWEETGTYATRLNTENYA